MLSIVWISLILISVIIGFLNGNINNVTQSIGIGASEAISLLISIVGIMCFWSGIMEILIASKLIDKLTIVLSPFLKTLFRKSGKDTQALRYISSNFTANLMGLSNAATPMGLKAAERIYTLHHKKGTPKELIMLVIINCSSIQLLPTTVAAIRTMYGANNAFDILPAVWLTSILSVSSGILLAKFFESLERR